MKRTDVAVERMQSGFNCTQSVFSAFAEELGIDRETAYRIACGFGGGCGGSAGTCGAVSGAIMAIGTRYGKCKADDAAAKEKTYALVRACMQRFREKNGSTICKELLGVDISAPEGLKTAKASGLFDTRCVQFVRDAAEILEDTIDPKEIP